MIIKREPIFRIFIILCLSFIFFSAEAQKNSSQFSLQLSPNFTRLNLSSIQEKSKLSFNGSFLYEMGLNSQTKITGGVGYMNVGARVISIQSGSEFIDRYIFQDDISYLHFPVGLKHFWGNFFVQGELAVGIKLLNKSSEITVYRNGTTNTDDNSAPIFTDIKTFNIPAFITVGHELGLNNLTVMAGLKAYTSLLPIVENMSSAYQVKYFGIGIVLGIKF